MGGPKGGGPNPAKVGARRVGAQTQKKWEPKDGGPNPEKVGARRVGAKPRKSGDRRMGARRVGARTQKKWGPEGWGPNPEKVGARKVGARRVGALNFALFFPLPPQNSFFSSLSGGLLVEFWWCLKRRGAQVCTFGVLGLSCEAPAAPKPPGFHTTTREPKRAHLRVLVFNNTTKIKREDTQRGKNRTNFAAREGKKSEILGGPGEGRSREGRSKPNLETNTRT